MLAAEIAHALHRLADARRCFGVHKSQDCRLVFDQCSFQLLEGEPLAPGLFDGFHRGAVTTGHIGESQSEIALDSNKNGVARLNRVGQGGFHGSAARATHRQGESVVGLPGVTKQLLNLPHQLHVERI